MLNRSFLASLRGQRVKRRDGHEPDQQRHRQAMTPFVVLGSLEGGRRNPTWTVD
jgi:hypothetical protein